MASKGEGEPPTQPPFNDFEWPTEEPENYGKYPNGWTEENWEEEMEKHPIFMTKAPDPNNLHPMIEAMRQLKYDPAENSRIELGENYRKDGNDNFKLKKYHWAIDSYTVGIKEMTGKKKEEEEDENLEDLKGSEGFKKLLSQLYGNRSASQLRLKNYRQSINDCDKAILLDKENKKCIIRKGEALLALGRYDDCVSHCKPWALDHPELEEMMIDALKKESEGSTRLKEEKMREAKKVQDEKELVQAIRSRGIKFQPTEASIFHSVHPGSEGHSVRFLDGNNKGSLVWPAIFVYPQAEQTDFILNFDETDTFGDHLEILFGQEPPHWDKKKIYRPDNLRLGFLHPTTGERTEFPATKSLFDVMTHPNYVLVGANPTFVVVPIKFS